MGERTDRQDQVAGAIKYLLNVSGASQKQLASFIHKDPSTITDRLKGRTEITVRDADSFAAFFDVGIDVLFLTEDELDEWITPERRRALRQRVAVIDLTDEGVSRTSWSCEGPYDLAVACGPFGPHHIDLRDAEECPQLADAASALVPA